jgi:hypothetical protein
MSEPTLEDLQGLACEDCPAEVIVQRGHGLSGPVLVVFVVHADPCPWARVNVPAGGATLIGETSILRHVRASDRDVSNVPDMLDVPDVDAGG